MCPELANAVEISRERYRWTEAYDAFGAVRNVTLRNVELGHLDTQEQMVVDIGETAAKVIFNATNPSAPFDYHAGWRMAPRVRRLVDAVRRGDFENRCWDLLIRRSIE